MSENVHVLFTESLNYFFFHFFHIFNLFVHGSKSVVPVGTM